LIVGAGVVAPLNTRISLLCGVVRAGDQFAEAVQSALPVLIHV
jgi:hypothetical protein